MGGSDGAGDGWLRWGWVAQIWGWVAQIGGWVAQMRGMGLSDDGGWVAQMIERQTAVAEVPGSNPASPQVEVI